VVLQETEHSEISNLWIRVCLDCIDTDHIMDLHLSQCYLDVPLEGHYWMFGESLCDYEWYHFKLNIEESSHCIHLP